MEAIKSGLPNVKALESQKKPRERLLTEWRVTKHGKFHFPHTRMLLVNPSNATLEWRKYSDGSPITTQDGSVPLVDISRVTKGKQSSVLSKLGVDEKCCLTIFVGSKGITLNLVLESNLERDLLYAGLLQILNE